MPMSFRCERGHPFSGSPRPTDRTIECPECGSSVRLASADQTIAPPPAQSGWAEAPAINLSGKSLAGGKYIVEELIRSGGMGQVYRAKQHDLDRDVAIKVLLPELAQDAAAIDRFIREAKIVAKLEHHNIVKVHDCQREDGLCYIVMELVLGPTGKPMTLASRIASLGKGGRFSVEEVVEYACDALDALQHIHQAGIIHRDVKPSNFLIGADGRIRLTDFGLATGARGAGAHATQIGTTMGTDAYMAPEQRLDAAKVDRRADLYSMGCVIYDLLIGSQSPNRIGLVSNVRDEVPREVDDVIRKAADNDPTKRFSSAQEMKEALLRAVGDPAAPPAARPGSSVSPAERDPDATLVPTAPVGQRLDLPTLPDLPLPAQMSAAPTPPQDQKKPAKKKSKRDGIVILGRSNAGKTLYITALYVRFKGVPKNPERDAQIIPYDQATEDYCRNKLETLSKGAWPTANEDSQPLEFSVNYEGGHVRLTTMDPKGEAFEKAFNPVHEHDADVKRLVEHIDHAAGLMLLSDPQAVTKGRSNDDWLFWKAVCHLCGDDATVPVDMPVALVLTKNDINAELIASAGGIDAFCAKRYPRLSSRVPELAKFAVSVCGQTTKNGKVVPVAQTTQGISDPFNYVLDALKTPPVDHVRRWMIIIITLAVLAGGFAAWYFSQDDKSSKTAPAKAPETKEPAR